MRNIFIIGPASVGKSTTGEILADKLGCVFIDIDKVFCKEIRLIPEYIRQFGYEGYCEANSNLVDELLNRYPNNTVFATPSGYLVHEASPHLVVKHSRIVNNNVTSILLLPSFLPEDSADEIAKRQVNRWTDLEDRFEQEKKRYIDRHNKYKEYGHVKVISMNEPSIIAEEMVSKLKYENLM